MVKQLKARAKSSRSKDPTKTESGSKANVDRGLGSRGDDESPDRRYLEVIEEMLSRRQNNGRDQDESVRGKSLKESGEHEHEQT